MKNFLTGFMIVVALGGLTALSVLVFVSTGNAQEPTSTPTATATPTPTATPTVDPEAQARADKVTFCVDLAYHHYLSSTGIELRVVYEKTYVTTDSGAEVFGILGSTDERLIGTIDFKCVYGDFMGETMMLTDFEVVESE